MSVSLGDLIASVRVDGSKVGPGLKDSEDEVRASGGRIAGIAKAAFAAAGAAGAVALAVGVSTNLKLDTARATLQAQLGTTAAVSERYGKIAGDLYKNAYGDSIAGVSDAVRLVIQNINGMSSATTASVKTVTAQVISLSQAFGQDLAGTTRAIDQMMRTGLASSAQNALDILTKGFQMGNDEAGDMLDTITEYGTQFRKLGLDGATAMGLISQGLKAGARDSDVVADAIKEFSIRAVDGSKLTADGFKAVGLNAKNMSAQIAKGGPTAAAALDLTLQKLAGIKDPAARAQAAVALFGTQAEDLGDALLALDPSSAVQAMGDVGGAAAKMDKDIGNTAENRLESFKRKTEEQIAKLTELPGGLGTAGAAVVTYGGSFLTVIGPIGAMIAAQKAATAASVAAGTAQQKGAIKSAAVAVGSAAKSVGSYVAMRTAATVAYLQIQAGAVRSAAATSAAWVASTARQGAAWTVTAARAVASATMTAAAWVASTAVAIASTIAAAAVVVAGWTMMGLRALASAAQMALAWLIALGPIGIVIALVAAVVAAIILNWDTVKSWTIATWNAIQAVISAVWGFIVSVITTYLNIVQAVISAVWGFIVGLITGYMNLVRTVISTVWGAIVAVVRTYINMVMAVIGGIASIPGKIGGWFNSAKSAAVNALSSLISWVTGVPGKLLSALGNLGSLLAGAGRDLMAGLLNGIVSGFKAILDKVSGMADKIKSLKGPKDYDLALLVPAGNWIMAGLDKGLAQGTTRVMSRVAGIAGNISDVMNTGLPTKPLLGMNAASNGRSVMGGAAAPTIHIEHYQEANGGDPRKTSEELYMLIKARG